MTHTTQVLSDEQIKKTGWKFHEPFDVAVLAFARAIESATLKAVSGQEPVGEIAACLPDGVGLHVSWLAHSGQKLRVGDKLFALPPAQPAPVDEREAWRELCRRLYVELFHCDQQMTQSNVVRKRPIFKQGATVRDVLHDAKTALEARAALQCAQAPQPTEGQP